MDALKPSEVFRRATLLRGLYHYDQDVQKKIKRMRTAEAKGKTYKFRPSELAAERGEIAMTAHELMQDVPSKVFAEKGSMFGAFAKYFKYNIPEEKANDQSPA